MWVSTSLWVSRPLCRLWTSPTYSPLLNELFPSLVHHPWASTCQSYKSFILYRNLTPHCCLAPNGTHLAPFAKVLQYTHPIPTPTAHPTQFAKGFQVHAPQSYSNCWRNLDNLVTSNSEGSSLTLLPLSHTTMGFDTTCWGDKHIGELFWKINITYWDTL